MEEWACCAQSTAIRRVISNTSSAFDREMRMRQFGNEAAIAMWLF